LVERVPTGWIEAVKRAVLPKLTALRHSVETLGVKVDALTTKVDSFRNEMVARVDSVEKRLPLIEDLAAIKMRLTEVERRVATPGR
jgi:hypothetical protein